MEYLDKVLGVKVTYEDVEFKHLPNFIATRYRLQMVSMNEQKMIFLYPKTELEQIEVLKKHIARIQKNENLPVVLVLRELSFRQKEYLIREKIPFIVDGKQIYLPFMAVYLQERCSAEKNTTGGNTSIGADASTAFHLWRCTGTIYKSSCEGLGIDTYFYIKGHQDSLKKWDCCISEKSVCRGSCNLRILRKLCSKSRR